MSQQKKCGGREKGELCPSVGTCNYAPGNTVEMPRESLLAIGALLCGPLPYSSVSCSVSDRVQQRCFQKEKEKKKKVEQFPRIVLS